MQKRSTRRGAAALAVGALCWALAPSVAVQADEAVFTIGDPRVTTPSAFGHDPVAGVYWTSNTGPGPLELYAIGPTGEVRTALPTGLEAVSVQDIARDGPQLYVADIGDPGRTRSEVSIQVVRNATADTLGRVRTWRVAYPDGPRDARAIYTLGGRVHVVTRGEGAGIYQLPEQPLTGQVNLLTRVADAPAGVTDADTLSADRVALRTYTSVLVIDPAGAVVASAATPWQARGEGLAYALNGNTLLLADGEGPAGVLGVRVPRDLAPDLAPGPDEPPPSPPPAAPEPEQPPASPDPEAEQAAEPGPSRTGTLVAVLLAGLVSVAAGVFVHRRR